MNNQSDAIWYAGKFSLGEKMLSIVSDAKTFEYKTLLPSHENKRL